MQLSFDDFISFSSVFERVRCVLARSFLVRNWCGAHLVVGFNELQPYPNAVASGESRTCRSTTQLAPSGFSQIYGRGRSAHHDRPTLFSAKDRFWREAATQ
jgi:hypothetical protein